MYGRERTKMNDQDVLQVFKDWLRNNVSYYDGKDLPKNKYTRGLQDGWRDCSETMLAFLERRTQ